MNYMSSQNYGGGLSPIGDGLGGSEDKMMPRPPQPNGSLHIKIDEVGNNSQLDIYHVRTYVSFILTRLKQ